MNHRVFLCAIALLTALSINQSFSQYEYWHRIFDGQGEAVGINPVNTQTIYAQDFSSQLRVSHNGGATWSSALSTIQYQTREILVLPRDTNVILAVNFFSGLLRSSDGGHNWTTVINNYGIDGVSVEYDPQHPDTIYAGNFSDAAVFRSIDRGLTWTLRGHASDGNLCTIVVRPDSSNILYAGAGGGRITKSTDYGATWRYVKPGGSVEIPRIVIDPIHPNIAFACAYDSPNPADLGVWKTTNGGETWSHTGLVNTSVWSLDIDQQHPDTVYAGSFSEYNAGVYRTTDGGTNWTLLSNGFYPYNSMWNMRVDQIDPSNVYMSATVDAFGFLGTFKLAEGDAGVEGTVRDSLTNAPLNNGVVRIEPTGDYIDMAYTGGTYKFFRPATDTFSTYTLNYYVNNTLVLTKTVPFAHGSIVSMDMLYTRGVIDGTVYSDLDGSGSQQLGEPGVANWQITLSGDATATTTTDANGHYEFSNLDNGSYTITAAHKYGYSATTSTSYNISVSFGAKSFPGRDFGSRQATTAVSTSPARYSGAASPSGMLSVTFPEALNPSTVTDSTTFIVRGSASGRHRGTIGFASGNTIVTFTPEVPFQQGEQVIADLSSGIHVQDGDFAIAPYDFRYNVESASSPMGFAAKQNYPAGTSPWGIAAGDLNGDGYNDLAVVNFGGNSLSVLLNNGRGGFPSKTDYSTPLSPRCVAIADVDGDGDLDIVTGQGAQNVSVFFNNGMGSFGGRTEYSGNGSVYSMLLEDVDGDGDIDIVTTSITGDLISVLKNNGNGTFASPTGYNADGAPWGAAAADINGDGGLDILVANAGTNSNVGAAENLGGGEYGVPASYPAGSFSRAIAAADFNGDGAVDVVAANNTSNSVTVYTNVGTGAFASRSDLSVGVNPWGVAAGDVDGDGLPDIVTANQTGNNVTVLRNNGGGSFSSTNFAAGSAPRMVILTDVDGDGRLDIITTNSGSSSISVMTNTTTTEATVGDGWNIVSVPVAVPNLAVNVLYPTASSSAFAYASGYQKKDTLQNGLGYWIKYSGIDTLYFIGNQIAAETVDVSAKWNLVGAISNPVAAVSITSIPPGLIESPFYGYSGGYSSADSLRPGKGYWVKVSASGKLVLSSAAAAPKAAPVNSEPANIGTLNVRDNAGREQALTLSPSSVSISELPPPPPAGAFDVRFASGFSGAKSAGTTEKITVRDAQYPLVVSWNIPTAGGSWNLGAGTQSVTMIGTGSYTVNSASDLTVRYAGMAVSGLPQVFALEQNYPNPFNPSTRIAFAVSEQSFVTVKVHDLLGREIAVLLNEARNPGSYSVEWNAADNAGGIYYVTLTAADQSGKPLFRETKKMALVK